MDRKSLLLCLSILAVLVLGTGIAVAVLYSGSGSENERNTSQVTDQSRYLLLPAIPSDAVAVACFSRASKAPQGVFDGIDLPDYAKKSRASVSLHYSGELIPLYVFDIDNDAEAARHLADTLVAGGLYASDVPGRAFVVASPSETILQSSLRHLDKGVSVMDAPGFVEASAGVDGSDVLIISNSHAGNLMPAVFVRKYSQYSGFMSRLADWTVFDLKESDAGTFLSGTAVYDGDASEFMTTLASSVPAVSSLSAVLPAYTRFAASLPLGEIDAYLDRYDDYLDSRQQLQKNLGRQKTLEKKHGVAPVEMMHALEVKEVAVASFVSGSRLEKVLLLRSGNRFPEFLFKGTEGVSSDDYVPSVHVWPYGGVVSSVFGNLFALEDESCFTFVRDWVIIGSVDAVSEYTEGRALEYTLKESMADAGQEDLLARKRASFVSYFSFSEASSDLSSVFSKSFISSFSGLYEDAEYCPAVLTVSNGKKGLQIEASVSRLTMQKTKAPVFERDTVVVVPEGPFEVMNSGTGKMNRFYQNSHLSLCLNEDGKDLWGVPFKKPLCGTARNVDYYANGKLQIVFGAGSEIYLIDRLGRYVSGFPVDLGKDILIGPEVYDFNGTKKYNVIVLHKDNTVEMYNLKGQKPASWRGIRPSETVKALPERILLSGNSFWVVRTSIQTLIYPFYGGEPLTVFTGDQMIRPDSEVTVVDDVSVEVVCYDGKRRTVKLK